MRTLLIVVVILLVPSLAIAGPAESVTSWTGWSFETLANVLLVVGFVTPIVGNGLAILFTRIGWLNAAAWVAAKTPWATKLATRALEAPTKQQAIRAIIEVAKEAHDDAPVSAAAELLRAEPIPVDDKPILEAVEPTKPTPLPLPVLLCLFACVVFLPSLGCNAAQKDALDKAIHGARDFQNFAAPIVAAEQKRRELACNGDAACVAAVEADFERYAAAPMKAFHDGWCFVAPSSEGC